jgi:hypothetical protein
MTRDDRILGRQHVVPVMGEMQPQRFCDIRFRCSQRSSSSQKYWVMSDTASYSGIVASPKRASRAAAGSKIYVPLSCGSDTISLPTRVKGCEFALT